MNGYYLINDKCYFINDTINCDSNIINCKKCFIYNTSYCFKYSS